MELMQAEEEEKAQMQNEFLCVSNTNRGYCRHLHSPKGLDQPTSLRDNSFCLLCGEQFENKFKLSLHMLQEHSPNGRTTEEEGIHQNYKFPLDTLSSISAIKVENFQQNRNKTKEVCETVTSSKQIPQESEDEGKTSSMLIETPALGATPTNSTAIQASKYWPIFNTSAIGSLEEDNQPPSRGFNSEAFCDLCNKEFCNKYFLKTHKANKHGIYNPNMVSTSNCLHSNAVACSPLDAHNRQLSFFTSLQQKYRQPQQASAFDGQFRKQLAAAGICEDDSLLQVDKIRKMLRTSQNVIFEQEEFSFIPRPRKLSPRSEQQAREANFTEDKLKLLGIVNPDAFCNLCCKEYCNEYFLCAHKWKQHEEAETQAMQKYSLWPGCTNTSGMPLNLISPKKDSYTTKSKKRIKLELTEFNSNTEESYGLENDDDSSDGEAFNVLDGVANKTRYQYIQQLQTIFQQIHAYNTENTFSCPVCGLGTGNIYRLQLHLISEHNTPPESVTNSHIQASNDASKNSALSQNHNEFNPLLDVPKHIKHIHVIPKAESPQPDGLESSERSGNAANVAPTSSYCDICNKELCNKYFMKTHMQRMHGIEIENGAQIGGVVCNICNKELCSKYFLRVHKHNTHGITEDVSPLTQQQHRQNGVNTDIGIRSQTEQKSQYPLLTTAQQMRQQTQIVEDASNEKLNAKVDSLDYTSQTIETNTCPICGKAFDNSMLLSSHIVSDHSKQPLQAENEIILTPADGQKKDLDKITQSLPNETAIRDLHNLKEYRCSFCPFTTLHYAFLFVHERTHYFFNAGIPDISPHRSTEMHSLKKTADITEEYTNNGGSIAPTAVSMQEVSCKTGRIASYALPQNMATKTDSQHEDAVQMQAFEIEETTSRAESNLSPNFLPAIVYLPVRERINSSVSVTFNLTPT